MKLIYKDMGHIISFDSGYVNELIIENKKMFFNMVSHATLQSDGGKGDFLLSVSDKPVEFSRYADVSVQFAPFQMNRKSLLTKLQAALEQRALLSENYQNTGELLNKLERYVLHLAEDFPFEVDCQRLSIGSVIKAVSPEIDETDKTGGNFYKIFYLL